MTTKIEVDGYDSRSPDFKVPFGYIYFTDGMRIGYSPGARQSVVDGLFICDQPYLIKKKGLELRAAHVSAARKYVCETLKPTLERIAAEMEARQAERKTYRATAVPEGEKFWVVTIDGLPDNVSNVTQALREEGEQHIEIMARDFISLALEVDEKSFDLDVEIKEAQP